MRFTDTREGLRIDLVDQSDFAMFGVGGTDACCPMRARLMGEVAKVIAAVPNEVIVRGHTDALPYAAGRIDQQLDAVRRPRRGDARRRWPTAGVPRDRFARIEGVADREPYVAERHLRSAQPPHVDHAQVERTGWRRGGDGGTRRRRTSRAVRTARRTPAHLSTAVENGA